MQQKKITRSIDNISKRKLSIQFSLDGFSFCISNYEDKIYHFSSYDFEEKLSSPEIILEKIQHIFESNADLQDDFESVLVIHENNLNSFVPNEYFKEEALKDYLKFNIKTIRTDFVAFDDLEQQHIKNVYVPYVNINNFLFQNFGSFEYKHHTTILVEKLLKTSGKEGFNFYINVGKSSFDLVVVENKKLVLYNSYEYNSKEDFIYYILFAFEQLKLDPDKTPITFMGNINKESDLYKIVYKYVRNLNFITTNSLIADGKEIENHSNFILLG
ncbi:DUF3822 family protein [Pseudotenacibaculum sp. MALMAid0570]|uniref:DUF3822 family protein n=1 Tax=Pseudotenacibaculum sp. MALMAid0570 TaxID=3143938 RepID=UPI0032E05246